MPPDDAPLPDPRRHADPLKGRGTATRLAHRFQGEARERIDDGWPAGDEPGAAEAPGVPATEVTAERAVGILSRNDSPDIPFTWALNPYRGCEHGCIYCYARPTHSYLNLSPGLDFETRLVAKVNAAERLAMELQRASHTCSPINIGSATDAWQPVEREWRLTRAVLEVLDRCRHPFTAVTKSAGIERDIDLIARAAERRQAYIMVSLTTLDAELGRSLEPRAAAPWRRLQTIRRLSEAGVPVGVNVAPIIPFVNEPEIERLVDAAADAGAHAIHYTIVRLPWEVLPLFQGWLANHFPERAERVMARIREMRGGRAYDSAFTHRMKGQGIWADLIRQRVRGAAARRGLGHSGPVLDTTAFDPALLREPVAQGSLF